MVFVKKETAKRLRKECHKGEKHDNLINRLIGNCEEAQETVALSPKTLERLVKFTGAVDPDEALNMLMDQYRRIKSG